MAEQIVLLLLTITIRDGVVEVIDDLRVVVLSRVAAITGILPEPIGRTSRLIRVLSQGLGF